MSASDSISRPSLPALGKITPAFFDEVIQARLGRPSKDVLVGPANGVDVGVVDIGGGQVMAMSTDPFFILPALGWERAAWFAVHIIASDVATAGLPLRYMTVDLNLPLEMREDEVGAMWQATHAACEDLGIAVVTGHTGRYQGCSYPMVGGATIIAQGPKDAYVTVGMTRPGDHVVITKGAAIEAAGLLAACFPQRVAEAHGQDAADAAQDIFWRMSTVRDSQIAVSQGVRDDGVTAMHDATECGVLGGLFEMSRAAGVGMEIDRRAIPVADDVARVCQVFDIDPLISISEGTLLMTVRPHTCDAVLSALKAEGITAARIGTVTDGGGIHISDDAGLRAIEHPAVDPFWAAFAREAERAAGA